jgi:hypothetical protein
MPDAITAGSNEWSDGQTDNLLCAADRDFYKVEK